MEEIRKEGRGETQKHAKQVSMSEHFPKGHIHLRHGCVHSAQNDCHDLQWLLWHVVTLNSVE